MNAFFTGLDWGGVRREWFELLCRALFAHESGFFTRFNPDDPQALVSGDLSLLVVSSGCLTQLKMLDKVCQ